MIEQLTSLCGHVKLDKKLTDLPHIVTELEIFNIRIRQHYELNRECWLIHQQDTVYQFIDWSVINERKRKLYLERLRSSGSKVHL